jgi:hypothetical protein
MVTLRDVTREGVLAAIAKFDDDGRFQFPNRSGRSRHGAPVRYRHTVASTTPRRSTGGRPVAFTGGNNEPITAQASSETTSRDTTQDFPIDHRSSFSNTP